MDLTKMQFANIILTEITLEDEDDIFAMAKMADDEGMQHGVWMARSMRVTDEQLGQLQDGIDPETSEPLSNEERLDNILKIISGLFERHYDRGNIRAWKIFSDDEFAGYMAYMGCYGAPYLHFLTTDDFSDAEDKADLICQIMSAAVPFLTYYFSNSKQTDLNIYPFQEDVEDMEFALGQVGFQQDEDLDYYDYERLACFSISKQAFEAFRDSLEA